MTNEKQLTMPNLSVNVTKSNDVVAKPEELVMIYHEVMQDIREDRKEIDNSYNNFCNMVFNESDATSASKEALVNLLKLKSDTTDKKTRVLEVLARLLLKDQPKTVTATQNNEFKFDRKLLEAIQGKKNGDKSE